MYRKSGGDAPSIAEIILSFLFCVRNGNRALIHELKGWGFSSGDIEGFV